MRALQCPAFEVMYGGARGGGKSDGGRGFLLKPLEQFGKQPQILKRIRGLVLRKDFTDLSDWIDKARQLYEQIGAKFTEDEIRFPGGYVVRLGHLNDKHAFTKYQGHEYHYVLIEELTQIASEELYLAIISCCRSTIPGVTPQVFTTCNPGGAGHKWVKQRFVKVYREDGSLVPPGSIMRDRISGLTRCFIPAKLTDNPTLMQMDPGYLARLQMQPKHIQEMWIDGSWDAVPGAFFDFRDKPRFGDPAELCHVIPPERAALMPWYPRRIGVDWGYNHSSAVYWGCNNEQDGRFHVYREYMARQTTPEELGAEIARRSLSDLSGLPDHSMQLHLSPDAFARNDSPRSNADQMRDGIEQVLGKGTAFLVELTAAEKLMDQQAAWDSLNRRYAQMDGKYGITIHMANNRRVDGWQYMRDMLRLRPIQPIGKPDENFARKLLAERGLRYYEEYLAAFKPVKPEVLPKTLIHSCCPKAIEALQTRVGEEGTEDILKDVTDPLDDVADSLRYLYMSFVERKNAPPLTEFVRRRLSQLSEDQGMMLHQVVTKAHQDYGATSDLAGVTTLQRTGRYKRHVQ